MVTGFIPPDFIKTDVSDRTLPDGSEDLKNRKQDLGFWERQHKLGRFYFVGELWELTKVSSEMSPLQVGGGNAGGAPYVWYPAPPPTPLWWWI